MDLERRRARLEQIRRDAEDALDHMVTMILRFEGPVPDFVPEEWSE